MMKEKTFWQMIAYKKWKIVWKQKVILWKSKGNFYKYFNNEDPPPQQ